MCGGKDGRTFNNNNDDDDTKIPCFQTDLIDTMLPPTAANTRNLLPPQPKGSTNGKPPMSSLMLSW